MKQTGVLQEQLENLLHEKYNLIPTDKVQMAIADIIKIINTREKGTDKTRVAEKSVDDYIKEYGFPPTYRMVQANLGLKSVNSTYYRLRNYRHKMKRKK